MDFASLKALLVSGNQQEFIAKLNEMPDEMLIEVLRQRDRTKQKCSLLDYAILYKHADCARHIINRGSILPSETNKLVALALLLQPLQWILYCAPGDTYQLLSQTEIDTLTAEAKLSALNLAGAAPPKPPYKKLLQVAQDQQANLVLTLIDKYLYLCNRRIKEAREQLHSAPSKHVQQRLHLSRTKRASLLKIIRLISATLPHLTIKTELLIDDNSAAQYLTQFRGVAQQTQNRYFGDDLSDDSDSDDEATLDRHRADPNLPKSDKLHQFDHTTTAQTPGFWQKTNCHTQDNEGVGDQLMLISQQIRNGANLEQQLAKLTKLIKIAKDNLIQRGTIYQGDEAKQHKVSLSAAERPTIFLIGTRGLNYMEDRWNADARRYHRRLDETQQPQYSEAVLKTLPYDYYTELSRQNDFHFNPDLEQAMQVEALRLHEFLESLNHTAPCVDQSSNHNGAYLFDSVGDCLQDHFSNGVDNHLADLAQKRLRYAGYWGTHLKNSFNPGIAIGSRPYHALKYSFALKDYYPQSMAARYWGDGTLEYPHVGKVLLALIPLAEAQASDGPHNISMQDYQGRISIGDQIAPEKELSYLGFMPGDLFFYQFTAKYPSFKNPWKRIHQIKYGLDQPTYDAFKHLFSVTIPGTPARNNLIELLSEWLCSYHEVLLIEKAKVEAHRRGGILAYQHRDGSLHFTPENGRIFTKGDASLLLRNEVHSLRELRKQLALSVKPTDKKTVPGFALITPAHANDTLSRLGTQQATLLTVTAKHKLSTTEEGLVTAKQTSLSILRTDYAKRMVAQLHKRGFFPKPKQKSGYMYPSHLTNPEHCYTDFEINSLLRQQIPGNIAIYAAQQPLTQGELAHKARTLFIDILKLALGQGQTAVIPVEVSQPILNEDAYQRIIGRHWYGLALHFIPNQVPRIEIIDPLNAYTAAGLLTDLIIQAAAALDMEVDIINLPTEQQQDDLDCGAWTVDNLVRRTVDQPLRTRADITGPALRQAQATTYQALLTLPQPSNSAPN